MAVVFTFPLQLYPAVQILKSVGRKLKRLSVSRVGYVAIDDSSTPQPVVEPPSETDTEADTPTRAIKPPRRTSSRTPRTGRRVLVAVAVAEVRRLDKIVARGGFLGIPLAFVRLLAGRL